MALLGLAVSIGFFNYVSKGRRPRWLQNRVKGLVEDIKYRSRRVRRSLPRDEVKRATNWITDASQEEIVYFLTTGETI